MAKAQTKSAIDSVQAGLLKLDAAKANTTPLAHFTGSPTSLDALTKTLKKAELAVTHLKIFSGTMSDELAAQAEASKEKFADIGFVDDDGRRVDTIGKAARQRMISSEIAKQKFSKIAETAEQRAQLTREVIAYRDAAAPLASILTDSVSLLMSNTLGSERRNRYQASLAGVGTIELRNAIHRACAEANADLAAACLATYDNLPPASRKLVDIPKSDVADALVGAQVSAARQTLVALDMLTAEAELITITSEDLKSSQQARYAYGLLSRKFDAMVAGEPIDDQAETDEAGTTDAKKEETKDAYAKMAEGDSKEETEKDAA